MDPESPPDSPQSTQLVSVDSGTEAEATWDWDVNGKNFVVSMGYMIYVIFSLEAHGLHNHSYLLIHHDWGS